MTINFHDAVASPSGDAVLFTQNRILFEAECDPLLLAGVPYGRKFSGSAYKEGDMDRLRVYMISCNPPEE
jgi:hypothetical protein